MKEYCYIEESECIQSSRHRTGLRWVRRLCANHDSIPLSRINDPIHMKLTQSPLSVLREGRSVMKERNQSHFASSVSCCIGRVLPCSSFDSRVHLHRRKPERIGWIGDEAYLNQDKGNTSTFKWNGLTVAEASFSEWERLETRKPFLSNNEQSYLSVRVREPSGSNSLPSPWTKVKGECPIQWSGNRQRHSHWR